jgi:hypothetical protein
MTESFVDWLFLLQQAEAWRRLAKACDNPKTSRSDFLLAQKIAYRFSLCLVSQFLNRFSLGAASGFPNLHKTGELVHGSSRAMALPPICRNQYETPEHRYPSKERRWL